MIPRSAAAGIAALAGLAGIVADVPTIWSPLNVLGFVPALFASVIFSSAAVLVPAGLLALAFVAWCPDVWHGEAQAPPRTWVLAVTAVVLSMAAVIGGRAYGLKYQGPSYVTAVTAISVLCWLLVGAVLVRAYRAPSPVRNLWAHLILFAWLGWYAFPYLGELP